MSEEHKHSCCCSSMPRREEGAASTCCQSKQSAKTNCCGVAEKIFLRERNVLIVSFFALVAGFCISYFDIAFPLFPFSDPSWIAVVLCGFPIFKGAYQKLVYEKAVTSALLISVAMIATISLQALMLFATESAGHSHDSFIFAAGEIAFFMALGEMIEGRTVAKTRAGIESLVKLAPQTAFRKIGEDFEEVEVSEIRIGDIVLVKPNAMISVDGIVIAGGGPVDQSSMTGEPTPAEKTLGDSVFAGTWNKSGAMTIRVERAAQDTAIAKLIKLVEEAEGRKAPIARVANKWAARIVPTAIATSVLVFAYAFFVLNADWISALVRGVTILVVFCPCAFALATPTAIAAGLGNAARRGILIKSGAALEELSRISHMVFDKTGTLTSARLKVECVRAFEMDESELLSLAASAEKHSEHPIAQAVLEYAQTRFDLQDPENTKSLAGVGVESIVGGHKILVCSFAALEKSGIDFAQGEAFMRERLNFGETLLCVIVDKKFAGVLTLSDEIKEDAKTTIAKLKLMGCKTAMLTGDNKFAAKRVADLVGIDEVYAELLPAQKAEKILALKAAGNRVCMIGDGVNDAPALANANVSVAMGALGSDLAIETADAAFLTDNITLAPGFLRLSRLVMNTIRANITVSLTISFFAVIGSAYAVFGPVGGALIHNASSVIVVLNSASILTRRRIYQ